MKQVLVDPNDDLLCPNCGGTHMHHTAIVVFDREEDEEKALMTVVSKHSTLSKIVDNEQNPSSRRDSVLIRFSCESCGEDVALTIVQHKGQTSFMWRK
jgi:hypothetical protein